MQENLKMTMTGLKTNLRTWTGWLEYHSELARVPLESFYDYFAECEIGV